MRKLYIIFHFPLWNLSSETEKTYYSMEKWLGVLLMERDGFGLLII